MEIEEVAAKTPEKIHMVSIDPATGILPFHARKIAFGLGLEGKQVSAAVKFILALYRAIVDTDASLVEINPLVITGSGNVIALDAKMNFDDNALFRHKDIAELRDPDEEDPVQRFQSIRNAYEVFRASGGATVAVADDDQYQQILTMAGKDSYAKSGAPIFGVSGFDASAMESYILQDASASEQQARAALSERENEKAALLASRALSLRQLLNGPESLEAASILNRSLARLNSQDGLFFFPESLNLGQDSADALLLYS